MSKDIDSLFDIIEGRRKAEREGGREGGGSSRQAGKQGERQYCIILPHKEKRECNK